MKRSQPAARLPDAAGIASPHAQRRRLLARTALFLLAFTLLQGLYGLGKGGWVERLVIDRATVGTAAWLIGTVDPGTAVQAAGSRLRAPGGGINVLQGCEGVEVVFLLAAAMLAAPLPWRARLLGLLAGSGLVFVLNQARVIALFYAFRTDQAWFDMLHGVLAPLLLVAAAGGFFAFWLNRHAWAAAGPPHQAT